MAGRECAVAGKKIFQVTLLAYLNELEFVSEQGGFLVFAPKNICRKIIFQPKTFAHKNITEKDSVGI